jgi:hypothetical protein
VVALVLVWSPMPVLSRIFPIKINQHFSLFLIHINQSTKKHMHLINTKTTTINLKCTSYINLFLMHYFFLGIIKIEQIHFFFIINGCKVESWNSMKSSSEQFKLDNIYIKLYVPKLDLPRFVLLVVVFGLAHECLCSRIDTEKLGENGYIDTPSTLLRFTLSNPFTYHSPPIISH